MEVKYVPKSLEDKDAKFEGYVIVTPPKYQERLKITASANFKVDEQMNFKMDISSLEAIANIVDATAKYVKEVHIVRKEDGHEYASYEEMLIDGECSALCQEIALSISSGIKLPKESKPR